jgi:glycosyltransferase involved in cell wall biosynthesis
VDREFLQVDQPLVSVIMNCYNGEKYLREALDHVLAQSCSNWEVIFWDNQSTDNSAEVFKSYKDPRFKYFYAPTHTLLYEARNYAIEQASGEFLAFLDVDDWWEPEKLTRQMPLFDDPEVGLVCSNYWIINESRGTKTLFRKKRFPQGWVLNDVLEAYPVGMLTLTVRRTAFDRLGSGCNPAYHVIGDLDLVVRLAVDWKMACNEEPLAFYRLHDSNEGQKHKKRTVNEYKIWIEEHQKNLSIGQSPAFSKVINEVAYLEGLVCLSENNMARVRAIVRKLPWGKYKLKLLIRRWLPGLLSVMKR